MTFEEIVETFYQPMIGHCRKVYKISMADCEDIIQTIFIKLAKDGAILKREPRLVCLYIKTAVKWAALDFKRKMKRQGELVQLEPDFLPDLREHTDIYTNHILYLILRLAPEIYWPFLKAYYIESKSLDEMAEIFQMQKINVKKKIYRGKKEVKENFYILKKLILIIEDDKL